LIYFRKGVAMEIIQHFRLF